MLARKMLSINGRLSSTQYRSEEKRFRIRPVGVVSKKVTVAWQQGNQNVKVSQLQRDPATEQCPGEQHQGEQIRPQRGGHHRPLPFLSWRRNLGLQSQHPLTAKQLMLFAWEKERALLWQMADSYQDSSHSDPIQAHQ